MLFTVIMPLLALSLTMDLINVFSSSSCHAYSMDSLGSLSPPSVSIGHCNWQVIYMASSICTELINISFCWCVHV